MGRLCPCSVWGLGLRVTWPPRVCKITAFFMGLGPLFYLLFVFWGEGGYLEHFQVGSYRYRSLIEGLSTL